MHRVNASILAGLLLISPVILSATAFAVQSTAPELQTEQKLSKKQSRYLLNHARNACRSPPARCLLSRQSTKNYESWLPHAKQRPKGMPTGPCSSRRQVFPAVSCATAVSGPGVTPRERNKPKHCSETQETLALEMPTAGESSPHR
jgi:hypothetical protein